MHHLKYLFFFVSPCSKFVVLSRHNKKLCSILIAVCIVPKP